MIRSPSRWSTGNEEYAFSWAYYYPGIAHLTGSCSSFISLQELPRQLCSKWWRCTVPSDLNSTQFNCSTNSSALANTPAGCPNQAWTHNWVESSGYGPLVAYPPASMQVTPDLLADYISNGTALPLKTVAILDQGNTQVIRGEAHNTSGQKVAMSCYNSR